MGRYRHARCVLICLLLIVACLLSVSCHVSEEDATPIDFRTYQTYEDWQGADGETVVIRGYMATATAAGDVFFQLVNAPYTRRPTAGENSFFIDVYPARGETVTAVPTAAIKVVGRVELAPQDKPFVDELGYESYVRLVDATYAILSAEELTGDAAVWRTVAASGLINNVMDAFNYAHFVCAWTEYTGKNSDGTQFYLYPEDARAFITEEGGQYYYGYSDGYFDRLSGRAIDLDAQVCAELSDILTKLGELSAEGLASLNGNNYTQVALSGEDILSGFVGHAYVLNDAEELMEEYEALFARLNDWLARFAL